MLRVGLTGGFGSGKSTVAHFFRELGAFIIDWDAIAREITQPHKEAWREIVEYFGMEILNEDLTINRKKLAQIVFNDPQKLKKLNEITHPKIQAEDEKRTSEIASLHPHAIIIKEIPLLTKASLHKIVDKIVVVFAPREKQIERLVAKGLTKEEVEARIKNQDPPEEKLKIADFIIDNSGSLEDTRRQVEEIYEILLKLERERRETSNSGNFR